MGGYWIQIGGEGSESYMISTASGELFYLQNPDEIGCSQVYYGTVSNSQNDLNGTGYTAQTDLGFNDGVPCQGGLASLVSFLGTVSPAVSIELTSYGTYQTEIGGEFYSAYDNGSSVSSIAGVYTLLTGDTMTVTEDGSLSLPEAATGCLYAGQVSLIDGQYAVYRLNVTATGCTSLPWNNIAQQGLISFLPMNDDYGQWSVFGGTSFVDANGAQNVKLFQ